MSPPDHPELARLPREVVDRIRRPFARFLRIEAAGGAVLLLGSLHFGRSIREWVSDSLMTLFFFLVALALKRELVLGELNNPRMAALSIAAALGGMFVPAALYPSRLSPSAML